MLVDGASLCCTLQSSVLAQVLSEFDKSFAFEAGKDLHVASSQGWLQIIEKFFFILYNVVNWWMLEVGLSFTLLW